MIDDAGREVSGGRGSCKIVRTCDRFVDEYARQLIWRHPTLKPKDSILVATAIKGKLAVLDSYDDGLLALDGKIGTPPLPIGEPRAPKKLSLWEQADKPSLSAPADKSESK